MHVHGYTRHTHRRGDSEHGHAGDAEIYSARPHPEPVVLDVGENIGALILHTDAALHGIEVEISPSGCDGLRTHKEVLEREINGHPAFTAVFDALPAGSYTLWVDDVARARGVSITGAAVAELDWSARSSHPC